MIDATRGEVTAAIETVYGANGLGRFEQLAGWQPDASLSELVRQYQTAPSPTYTYFFRQGYETLRQVARYALLWKPPETHVQVAQIGASGQETWSMATVFAECGMNYDIAAYDVNSKVLARAHGPFNSDDQGRQLTLRRLSDMAGWAAGCEMGEYFEETQRGVVPRDVLRERASFAQHDIVASPLPDPVNDVVSIHNVLWHYPLETRNHIMANIMEGLQPEGIFFYEGLGYDSRQAPGYDEWTYGLRKYGLYESQWDRKILRYWPEHADVQFTRSQTVVDALGTLAALSAQDSPADSLSN